MKKLFLLILSFILLPQAFATSFVGISNLVMPENNDYITNYNSGVELEHVRQINKNITRLTIHALNNFNQDLLSSQKTESTIILFDAVPKIQDLLKSQDKLLDDIATQDITPIDESEVTVLKNPGHRFYLIGYVTKISCGEVRHKIMTSSDISWLYNLDIVIKFRVVDAHTLKVVAEFTALGHGGMARILNDVRQTPNINPEQVVNSTIKALTNNIWHNLLILEQKGD